MQAGLAEGATFGDYRVVRRLGKGGMGEVWLLENAEGGQLAAKILTGEADHESRKRFLREAELALGVKHPNLVEVFDVGADPDTGLCYILMEYVPGGTLADVIREIGPLPIENAIAVVKAIAGVLELGRQKGIVHRDIKPANIMFGADGTPKLADLGIARGGAGGTDTTTVTQTGVMIGTPAYMASEQMLDAHHVDTRADIYSLGVVFFEMLTGERPNKDDTVVQLMAKAVKGEPLPDVRTLRPEVSASLAQLLSMMVVPSVELRIAVPKLISSALDNIERGGTFEARDGAAKRSNRVGEASSPRQRERPPKSFPWKVLIPVGILGALAAMFVIFGLRGRKAAPLLVRETVVITNTVEQTVVQVRTVTNVAERIVKVREEVTPSEDLSDRVGRSACERRVEHIIIRSKEGVRRDVVDRIADWIEKSTPRYRAVYGDPYAEGVKKAPFAVSLNYQGKTRGSGGFRPGYENWEIIIGGDGNWTLSESTLSYMLAASLVFAPEGNWVSLIFYTNHLEFESKFGEDTITRTVEQGRSVDPTMRDYDWRGNPARRDVPSVYSGKNYYPLHQWRSFGPLEELRKEHPSLMRDYFALKMEKAKAGDCASGLSVEAEVRLFSAVIGKDVWSIFKKYGWPLVAVSTVCQTSDDVKKVLAETRVPVLQLTQGMPMGDAVDFLRQVSDNKINFIVRLFQGQLSVKQSLVASDITLRDALALVCDANDYRYGIRDNIVIITSKGVGEYRWIDIPKTPLADKLRKIVIPEVVIRPPMTITDAIQIFIRAEKQVFNQSSIVLSTHQGFDISSVLVPTMVLRECSYLDALDLVCQSVDFTFTVDKSVNVRTRTLAEMQSKHGEQMNVFTDAEISAMRKMDPDKAVRTAFSRLFPDWKVTGENRKPYGDGEWAYVGYFKSCCGRNDVCNTFPKDKDGPVCISRTVTLPKSMPELNLSVTCPAAASIGGGFTARIFVDGQEIDSFDVFDATWQDRKVSLGKWSGKKVKIEVRQQPRKGTLFWEACWSKIDLEGDDLSDRRPVGTSGSAREKGPKVSERDTEIDVQEIGFSWGVPVGQALSSAPVVNGVSAALPAIEAKIAKLKPLVAKIQKQYEVLIADIDARRVSKEWSDLRKFMDDHAKLQQSKTGKWKLTDWELKSEEQGARNRELTLLEVIRLQTKSADVKRQVESSLKTKWDKYEFHDECMREAQRLVNGKAKSGKSLDPKKLKDPDPTRAVQKTLDAMFPGWMTSEAGGGRELGYLASHRGVDGVLRSHPPCIGEPVTFTKNVEVKGTFPMLHLRLSNHRDHRHFRLRVKVDGKLVREKDITDGWTDVYVNLGKWKDKKVKLELEHWPTGWCRNGRTGRSSRSRTTRRWSKWRECRTERSPCQFATGGSSWARIRRRAFSGRATCCSPAGRSRTTGVWVRSDTKRNSRTDTTFFSRIRRKRTYLSSCRVA